MTPTPDEFGVTEPLTNDSDEFRKFHQTAVDTLKKALELYGNGEWGGDWKLNAEEKESGDKVYVRKTDSYGNVYALQAKINASPEAIFRVNWDDVADINKWNPSIKEFKVVSAVGSQSQLVNNASEPLLGGLVSSRDFVDVRLWRKVGDALCLSARSVQYDKVPPQKGRVRADNKLGILRISPVDGGAYSSVVWMTCIDLKGMLMKSVVERTMNSFLLDYARHLKKHMVEISGQ